MTNNKVTNTNVPLTQILAIVVLYFMIVDLIITKILFIIF